MKPQKWLKTLLISQAVGATASKVPIIKATPALKLSVYGKVFTMKIRKNAPKGSALKQLNTVVKNTFCGFLNLQ